MKVKLLEASVINGAVWSAGSIVVVSEVEGSQLIAQNKAVAVETTAAPKPSASSTAKKDPEN